MQALYVVAADQLLDTKNDPLVSMERSLKLLKDLLPRPIQHYFLGYIGNKLIYYVPILVQMLLVNIVYS